MTATMTVCVVGLGYIGLPTAAMLAAGGVQVHGVDVNQATADAVAAGRVPFVEADLAELVDRVVAEGRLTAGTVVTAADAHIIAVPTPVRADRSADTAFVHAAARSIATVLRPGDLVIVESTVPPGTTEQVGETIAGARPDLIDADGSPLFQLAHCPERVLPGRILAELVSNDRMVGGTTSAAAERARTLYATFCEGEISLTDARTAELAKLVENSYRDVNIAFANELSMIAADLGVDVWELIELANHHPRVNILQPGPGVGGHCIAVDPWFIVDAAPLRSQLIRTAREVNDAKPGWVVEQVRRLAAEPLTIAALGLTFKPDVDDLRGSPAVQIVQELAERFPASAIVVVDPHVPALPAALADAPNVSLTSLEQALRHADIAVLLVDHSAFTTTGRATLEAFDGALVDTRGVLRRSV